MLSRLTYVSFCACLQRGEEKLRLEVLRRIPLKEATGRRDVIWARTKKNGNGNGNNSGTNTHMAASTGGAVARSAVDGGSEGNGSECVIALQQLELWSSIGRWHIDEPQGSEGGGVLGAVLCCYPDPQPVSSPPPVTQPPTPPPDLACRRNYPTLQRGHAAQSYSPTTAVGRGSPSGRPAAPSSAAPSTGAASVPHNRFQ